MRDSRAAALDAAYDRGIGEFARGDFAASARSFSAVVRERPGDASAQALLGRSYEAQGKLEMAEAAYGATLAAKPDQPEIRYHLALIGEARGDTAAAIKHLERAVELDAAFVGARLALGRLYEQGGQRRKAAEQYAAVLKVRPVGIDARALQERLDNLK